MDDTENNVVYAGFWLRLCAAIIDLTLVLSLIWIPMVMIYGVDDYLKYFNNEKPFLGVWHFILEVIVPFILVIWLWLRFSATPGKMLLRLKVVDIKTSEPISFRQAIIRYFGYVPSILCFFIGIIWVVFDIRKQGWHDKLASTAVIRVNK
jgi:uncharacterized RDD family membrane protein YckC